MHTMLKDIIPFHINDFDEHLMSSKSVYCVLSSGLIMYVLYNATKYILNCNKYNELVNRKKENLKTNFNKIRLQVQNLNTNNNQLYKHVFEMNVTELRDLILSNKLEPVDLLHLYQLKVLELIDTCNSGVAEFILDAESIFTKLDQESIEHLPLFGIPISVKETCSIKGCDATVGVVKRCNQPVLKSSVLIDILRNAGAIPFVTTITNQVCRSIDGFNPVYGNITHPFNNSRIPGGSSTGEGVLLALKGSPVGIGSDIAGSIRIPAAFCGLVGLKPSYSRFRNDGMTPSVKRSYLGIEAVCGPMGKTTNDLVLIMKTLLKSDLDECSFYNSPKSFDNDEFISKKPLRIGYYTCFNNSLLFPTLFVNQNAVLKAVSILSNLGHDVVDFKVPQPEKAFELALRCLSVDAGCEFRNNLNGEHVGPHLKSLYYATTLPSFMLDVVSWITAKLIGKPAAICHFLKGVQNGRMAVDLLTEVDKYKQEFSRAWKQHNLDAIICPVIPYPAPSTSTSVFYITPSVSYCALYNLLDYPAGTVPMGFVNSTDVQKDLEHAHNLKMEGKHFESKIFGLIEGGEGLPLSVQVVAKPHHEETVLRLMNEIEMNKSV